VVNTDKKPVKLDNNRHRQIQIKHLTILYQGFAQQK